MKNSGVKKDFDFWVDANKFVRELLPTDVDDQIIRHLRKRRFSKNDTALFKSYCSDAIGLLVAIAEINRKVKRK